MWKRRLFSKKATNPTSETKTKSNSSSFSWTWRFSSSAFRFKHLDFQLSIIDDILFKIVSVFEAILLVSALCFFFVCCGCKL
ncbi:hypothetical protein ACHQM5_004551 [Ranunculus cassubicifolius]